MRMSNTSKSRFYFLYNAFHAIMSIGDFMDEKLLVLTESVIKEIEETSIYKGYLESYEAVITCETVKPLSENFKNISEKYYEAKKYGKHHPDLKTYQIQFVEAKTALYNNDKVKRFKHFESALQDLLDQLTKRLAHTVSSRVKTDTKMNFIERGGSSCSSE